MKKKSKIVFWGFFSLDYKAMEEYLEQMAEKGWMLEKAGRVTAKFRAIKPKTLKFYIDVFKEGGPLTPENTEEALEYRELCRASGWIYIASRDHLQFFYAEADSNPVPIQTDQALEQNLIESTLWKYELLSVLVALLVMILLISKSYCSLKYTVLLNFTGVVAIFSFPFLGLPILFIGGYGLIWMLRSRRNIKNGLVIKKPTLKAAKRRAMVYFLPIIIFTFILLLAIAADTFYSNHPIWISLLPPLIGIVIGLGLRFAAKKIAKEKSDVISYIAVTIFILLVMGPVATSLLSNRETDWADRKDIIPDKYPVVTMYDLPGEYGQGVLASREFKYGMSPVIPRHYTLWETWDVDGRAKGMRISYYRAINPYFADIVFNGVVKELEEGFKWRGMRFHTRTIISEDALKNAWNVDELALTEEREQIIILKENVVVRLEGDIEFEDEEVKEVIMNTLLAQGHN